MWLPIHARWDMKLCPHMIMTNVGNTQDFELMKETPNLARSKLCVFNFEYFKEELLCCNKYQLLMQYKVIHICHTFDTSFLQFPIYLTAGQEILFKLLTTFIARCVPWNVMSYINFQAVEPGLTSAGSVNVWNQNLVNTALNLMNSALNLVNNAAADILSSNGSRSPATTVLTLQDNFVFQSCMIVNKVEYWSDNIAQNNRWDIMGYHNTWHVRKMISLTEVRPSVQKPATSAQGQQLLCTFYHYSMFRFFKI